MYSSWIYNVDDLLFIFGILQSIDLLILGSSMDGLDRGRPRATAPASRDIGPPRCSPPQAVANADTHSPAVLLAWLSSGDLESVRAATLGVQGLV